MRKPLVVIAAASLAAGTLAFVGYQSRVLADDYSGKSDAGYSGKTDTGARAAENLPQGVTAAPADQTDTAGIRRTLGNCVDYVASSDWNNFGNCFASSDRQRIDFSHVNPEQFNKTLTQFQQDWKAKYNQDFSLKGREEVVFGGGWRGFDIVQGEVSNPAMLSNWPVEPGKTEGMREGTHEQHMKTQKHTDTSGHEGMHASAGGPGQPSVNITPKDTGTTETKTEARTDTGGRSGHQLGRGTTVAVVTFPAQQNAPEATVSLIREGAGAKAEMRAPEGGAGAEANVGSNWRIDIPDSINSQKLVDNLNTHLSHVDQMKDQWPTDVNQAYRIVSQHLYLAMYDTGAAGGMRSGDMEGADHMKGGESDESTHSEK